MPPSRSPRRLSPAHLYRADPANSRNGEQDSDLVATPVGAGMTTTRRLVRVRPVVLLAGALMLAGCAASGGDRPPELSSTAAASESSDEPDVVGVEEFARVVDDPGVMVVNVHVPYEGEVPGTDAFVAFDQIVGDPALPDDPDEPIALYCRSGSMSAEASAALAEAGFTNITDLKGGMNAWRADGRELVVADR